MAEAREFGILARVQGLGIHGSDPYDLKIPNTLNSEL